MINLFKANIFRLFHTKATYIILIITVSIYLFSFAIMNAVESGRVDENSVVTVSFSEDYEPASLNPYEMLIDMMSSGFVILMIGIFSCIYTDEERKSGFLKNLPRPSRKKAGIFITKVFVVAFYTLLLVAALVLAAFLLSVKYGSALEYAPSLYFEYMFKQVLLFTTFGTAMMVLFEIFRKGVVAIILTFLTSMALANCVNLFEAFLVYKNIVSEKCMDLIAYSQYMITTRSAALSVGSDNMVHGSTWVVGLISVLIYVFIGSLIYKKRDVI